MSLKKFKIKDLGLSIKFNKEWPILEWQDDKMKGIYQPIDDGQAIVFLRYGTQETLEKFTSSIGDALNQVLVKSIKKINYLGNSVERREVIIFRANEYISVIDRFNELKKNGEISQEFEFLVIGLDMFSMPVLVGYRIPAELEKQYRKILNKIVLSIKRIK